MKAKNTGYIIGTDGHTRCWWPGQDPEYIRYHDEEWGRPVYDDTRLFEKLCLEGFQSGLSWITVLRKRENFREAFCGFDFNRIAKFTDADVDTLLHNAGIIRHRGKIEATINNARCVPDIINEYGSFADYIWSFKPKTLPPAPQAIEDIPTKTPESSALSKDLKKRGFKFVGPTTMYALMQAMGMVNDHLDGCFCRI